jgi:hypothetical protein
MTLLPVRRTLAAILIGFFASACSSTWTELGPKSAGRVSAIVATNASNVWVATPGGGVWKSTDGGATFTWAGNYGLGDFTAVHLALDRNDPSRIYLRTFSGVLVTTDGAAHWTRTLYSLPQGDTPYPYPSFCSSWPACPPIAGAYPDDPQPWAQTVFSPTQSLIVTSLPCQGLQYSTDSGNSFTQLWPFPGPTAQRNPDNCINSIAIDDVSHRVWFTTMNDSTHIYRSSAGWTTAGPPGGMTWDLVTSGIAVGSHQAIAVAWGGGLADRVMALVKSSGNHVPYLFDGTAWVQKPITASGCFFGDARALVAGGTGNDFYAGGVTFAYTLDAGTTWVCPPLGMQYVDIRAIFPSPSANRLWIGGDQNQLGAYGLLTRYTWSPGVAPSAPVLMTATGITSWQAYSIAKAPASNRLLVGAQDIGVACSDDGGSTWTLTPPDESQSVLWAKTGGGNRVYTFGTQTTNYKATNAASAANCGAISWSNVSPPDALKTIKIFSAPHTMAIDPLNEAKIFTLTGARVLYSTDSGTNWHASDVPLTTPTGYPVGLTALFVDEDGVVYVGTLDHGVYTCTDTTHYCDGSMGAGSWTPFALNPGGAVSPPWYVTAIAESNAPPAARTFWIATSQGVYRRLAGSTEWNAVDAISLYPYSDVVVDPTCKTRVYTAIGYLGNVLRTRGGIHVSTDNGANWTSITSGFPLHNVPITQVIVDAANPQKVYASTYGRGAWVYTWGSLPACAP